MTDAHRPRIALINDDSTFLELMLDLLESTEGHQVLICKESQNAYELVEQQQPDLVLLDIRMDGQEAGWKILVLLTLDPSTRHIPVIVCSAAITELRAHDPALQRLGIDVLPKPFDLDALLEKVCAALERSRAAR